MRGWGFCPSRQAGFRRRSSTGASFRAATSRESWVPATARPGVWWPRDGCRGCFRSRRSRLGPKGDGGWLVSYGRCPLNARFSPLNAHSKQYFRSIFGVVYLLFNRLAWSDPAVPYNSPVSPRKGPSPTWRSSPSAWPARTPARAARMAPHRGRPGVSSPGPAA